YGHNDSVMRVVFSADGKQLASMEPHGPIILWSLKDGKAKRRFEGKKGEIKVEDRVITRRDLAEEITEFAFSPDGKMVAASFYGKDGPVRIWDAHTGKLLRTIRGSDYAVRDMAFSPDSKMLALASQNGLRLWEAATGKERWNLTVRGNQVFGIH